MLESRCEGKKGMAGIQALRDHLDTLRGSQPQRASEPTVHPDFAAGLSDSDVSSATLDGFHVVSFTHKDVDFVVSVP